MGPVVTYPAGSIVLYRPKEQELGFMAPDDSGCVPALVTGVSPKGANLWVFPNTPGQPPSLRMGVTEGDGAGQWSGWDMPQAVSRETREDPTEKVTPPRSRRSRNRSGDD